MNLVITVVLPGLLASVPPSTIGVFIPLLATARARVNAVDSGGISHVAFGRYPS
jgi:hypothetical protein